jgi:CubicO group peptidase (beta-lactamase class C family)
MDDGATPGASVAVIDHFDVVWARGVGKPTIDAADVVSQNTPFQAGSISKAVFALAVMRLVEAGSLGLDIDVNDYLKSWKVPGSDGWRPRLTLRQLLSHTAGTTVQGFAGYPVCSTLPTVTQVLRGLPPANSQPVVVDLLPGMQFRYSGGGTTIAQQVVVDVTGKSFPDLMRELVLTPLGMSDSSFEQPPPNVWRDKAAMGHPWNAVQTPGGYRIFTEMAAAGLWTTAADLASLGADVLRTLRGDASRLGLSRETIAEMLRPQLKNQEVGQDFVGLGWFCAGRDKGFRFGHPGMNEGFAAEMRLFPAIGKGAIVMFNSIQGGFLRNELLDAIGREYQWPATESSPAPIPMTSEFIYAGLYRSEHGALVHVTQNAQGLLIQYDQQSPLSLFPTADGEFFTRALPLRVRFADSNATQPNGLSVVLGGGTIQFKRVDT